MGDRLPAAFAGKMLIVAFGGRNFDRQPLVTRDLIAGGSGAAHGSDGVDVIKTDATNCMNLPAEAIELQTPIRLNHAARRPNSGGSGTHHGGLGTIHEYEVLTDGISLSPHGKRHYSAAQGVAGGGNGISAISDIYRADGSVESIPSKTITRLNKGDRVVVQTTGKADHDNPAHRIPPPTPATAPAVKSPLIKPALAADAHNATYKVPRTQSPRRRSTSSRPAHRPRSDNPARRPITTSYIHRVPGPKPAPAHNRAQISNAPCC
ncbi:MAG: hypothetical protein EXR05_06760 [Acetobacteraceae bacterium]|nr:hypothetical protein [Acetobacteraceae bacterium]